jgi:hypothetical protein
MSPIVRNAIGVAIAIAILVAAFVGYRQWTQDYAVTRNDDGVAVARVIVGTLHASEDLRVSRLSGTVQATARTSRLWGWLKSERIVKAPYTVDYLVPLGGLSPRDFRYDEGRRVLFVAVPDVVVGPPNVDEANVTLDRTSGAIVSRDAMAELQKRASGTATRVVADKAREPENLRKARENGRAALERLFGGALGAAGLPVRVEVRFAGEARRPDGEQWDLTRSLEEVLGNVR